MPSIASELAQVTQNLVNCATAQAAEAQLIANLQAQIAAEGSTSNLSQEDQAALDALVVSSGNLATALQGVVAAPTQPTPALPNPTPAAPAPTP